MESLQPVFLCRHCYTLDWKGKQSALSLTVLHAVIPGLLSGYSGTNSVLPTEEVRNRGLKSMFPLGCLHTKQEGGGRG